MKTTKQVIAEMLVENTGRALCDSGDYYGRNYDRNKGIDFETQPRVSVDWKYKTFSISLYHFLNQVCDYNLKLDKMFNTFSRRKENNDKHWLALAHDFPIFLRGKGLSITGMYGEGEPFTVNTYNNEDALSQVIQYVYFELDNDPYVALSIHGGCDVRGGYTKPHIFSVDDNTGKTIFDNAQLSLYCPSCEVVFNSDNAGYAWMCNHIGNLDTRQLTLPGIKPLGTLDVERSYDKLLAASFEQEEYDGKCPCCNGAILLVDF